MTCSADFSSKARHRIQIDALVLNDDDYGGQEESWLELTTVWGMMSPISGNEFFRNQQLDSNVTHKFMIRYLSSLKDTREAAKHRIQYDDRIFDISHVRNLDDNMKGEGRAFQELYAIEREPSTAGGGITWENLNANWEDIG